MISPEIDFFSTYKTYNIIHDPQIIQNTLGEPANSPFVEIEHWEEEY